MKSHSVAGFILLFFLGQAFADECGKVHVENVIYPISGGIIKKIDGDRYYLSATYRTGEKKCATGQLVQKINGHKIIRGEEKVFKVDGCGDMNFLRPEKKFPHFYLLADDEFTSAGEAECPIYFGSVENSWIVD